MTWHLELSKVILGHWPWLNPCITIVINLAGFVFLCPETEYVANFSHRHNYSVSLHYLISIRAIDSVCPKPILAMSDAVPFRQWHPRHEVLTGGWGRRILVLQTYLPPSSDFSTDFCHIILKILKNLTMFVTYYKDTLKITIAVGSSPRIRPGGGVSPPPGGGAHAFRDAMCH